MKTVLVVFGGRSAEHDVSIITAHVPIIQALQAVGRFRVVPLYVTKGGAWYSDQAFNGISYFKDPNYEERLRKLKSVQLSFKDGLRIIWPGLRCREERIDVVFPAMHGTYGEDGSLMGLLRLANVPFVGCDLAASVVAMDKVLTKEVAAAAGISVTASISFTDNEWSSDREAVQRRISKLTYPLFVKPTHLGSSIGITKVKAQSELENALEVAVHYDTKVLVEEGVPNLIEVTLPIMGNGQPTPGLLERALNKNEFFDFTDKYLEGGKKTGGVNSQYSELPARLEKSLVQAALKVGLDTYRALGCEGIARVDMLIDQKAKKVYMNEVNTLPGSLYHHNWRKAGVSGAELVTRLIGLGEERATRVSAKTWTFDSTILHQADIRKGNQ